MLPNIASAPFLNRKKPVTGKMMVRLAIAAKISRAMACEPGSRLDASIVAAPAAVNRKFVVQMVVSGLDSLGIIAMSVEQ